MQVNTCLSAVLVGEATPGSYSNTVGIVSDRQLSVAALAALLVRHGEGIVIQRARGADEIAKMLRSSRVEVVIAEGTWRELPPAIRSVSARVLLVVDPYGDFSTLVRRFRSGADGFVSQAASTDGLRTALTAVRTQGSYVDPSLETCLRETESRAAEIAASSQLSDRERLILAAIANGKSSKQIAGEFSVTAKTVCNHVSNVYRKLELTHRGELVKYAFDQGLTRF